jgi:hypothetical protein
MTCSTARIPRLPDRASDREPRLGPERSIALHGGDHGTSASTSYICASASRPGRREGRTRAGSSRSAAPPPRAGANRSAHAGGPSRGGSARREQSRRGLAQPRRKRGRALLDRDSPGASLTAELSDVGRRRACSVEPAQNYAETVTPSPGANPATAMPCAQVYHFYTSQAMCASQEMGRRLDGYRPDHVSRRPKRTGSVGPA